MVAVLKSFSDNTTISIILVYVFIDCLFSFKLFSYFLVYGEIFQLKLGHFGCYIMGLWFLFKPSVLAFIFLGYCSSGGRAPCYGQVRIDIWVPHLTSNDT